MTGGGRFDVMHPRVDGDRLVETEGIDDFPVERHDGIVQSRLCVQGKMGHTRRERGELSTDKP